MHSVLDAALLMARRGFRVFPLRANSKEPAGKFLSEATADEVIIRAWFIDPVTGYERAVNYGVLCTDHVVADIDVKDGQPGLTNYEKLGGHFDTFVVRTPSGGFHCYFVGPDSANVDAAEGINIRSHNGYVVGPGSVINGARYDVINDAEMTWVPPSIERVLAPVGRRDPRLEVGVELDMPQSIEQARDWLTHNAPIAIEGQGGDNTTFQVAARLVRDFALTTEAAFDLLIDWNERCFPPWPLGDLLQKGENAEQYGTQRLGAALTQAQFGSVHIVAPPPVVEMPVAGTQSAADRQARFGNVIPLAAIPARPWLAHGLLMRGEVTTLTAPGAAGKSAFGLALASHLVRGVPFGPWDVKEACKVIVWNGEDDLLEQSRRLHAVCSAYNLEAASIADRLMLLDDDMIPLRFADLATDGSRQPLPPANGSHIRLAEYAADPDVGAIVLDPLSMMHGVDENDNAHMTYVMNMLKALAVATNTAILVAHHSTKGKAKDGAGSQDLARGAGAIVNRARINLTMTEPSASDIATYRIRSENVGNYVRVDGAKINATKKTKQPAWFRWTGVTLSNGDGVGALQHTHELIDDLLRQEETIAQELWRYLKAMPDARLKLSELKKAKEPFVAKLDAATARKIATAGMCGLQLEGDWITLR